MYAIMYAYYPEAEFATKALANLWITAFLLAFLGHKQR